MRKYVVVQSVWFKGLRKMFWSNKLVKLSLKSVDDSKYLKWGYWWHTLNKLDLKNPKLYTEKLQWINKNCKDPIFTQCTDKYLVRKYILETLGESEGNSILNTLYGVYYNLEDIDLNSLPISCVLKANHGSGWNLIIKDKRKIDWVKSKKTMKKWLKSNYYYNGRQYQYKNIKPAIICEEYLENDDGTEILDYKFMCFNGEPTMLWMDYDRYTRHIRNHYDLEGNPLYYVSDVPADYNRTFIKPENYDKMVEIARKLAKPFPHVRIDLYNLNGRIIFGEMTFTSWGGYVSFETPELDKIWGECFANYKL